MKAPRTVLRLGSLLLLSGLLAALCLTLTGCEDDPIVQPNGATKPGGSYGGRLTLPDSSGISPAGPQQTARPNPAVF